VEFDLVVLLTRLSRTLARADRLSLKLLSIHLSTLEVRSRSLLSSSPTSTRSSHTALQTLRAFSDHVGPRRTHFHPSTDRLQRFLVRLLLSEGTEEQGQDEQVVRVRQLPI
jgi:hypothetical protein